MKKLLRLLLISNLSLLAVNMSSTAANTNLKQDNNLSLLKLMSDQDKNLNDVIKQKELGIVLVYSFSIPEQEKKDAVLLAIAEKNPDVKIQSLVVESLTFNSAVVTTKDNQTDYARSSTLVTFNLKEGKYLSLNSVLKNTNLGEIKTVANTPTDEEIKAAIKKVNPKIILEHIIISYKSHKVAQIVGDDLEYWGGVIINYYTNNSPDPDDLIALSTILKESDLKQITFDNKVNEEQIKQNIKKYNENLDIENIKVDSFDFISATIVGDNIKYEGSVIVTFKSIVNQNLETILVNKNLEQIKITKKEMDQNLFGSVLKNEIYAKNQNPNDYYLSISISRIEFTDSDKINQDSTTVEVKGVPIDDTLSHQINYIGTVEVTFKFIIE